jgi:hypothetical protein
LRKVPNFTASFNCALIGLTITSQDLGQGGLAGTVSANQTNLVTLIHSKINASH